jgi:uncharacterized integral membrane protein (TIGR00698 family)
MTSETTVTTKSRAWWPGIIYCASIAAASLSSYLLVKQAFSLSISTLMWAFIYSILLANLVPLPESCRPGIEFCANSFLKGLIASQGLVTNALIWVTVGPGIVNALAVILLIFFSSLWIGRRLGLSDSLSTLIGVGTCICGASAIAATAPAIEAKEEEMGLALACITLFGLGAMFLYPFLFTNTLVGDWLAHNLNVFAIWVGTGIHETAQVAAAGGALGVACEALAIKSIRIFMIGPMVLLASYMKGRRSGNGPGAKAKLTLPAYAVAFIVFSVLGSILDAYAAPITALGFDWLAVKATLTDTIFKFLFAVCFAGVGSKVKFTAIATIGVKSFGVGAMMAILAGLLALVLAIGIAPFIPMAAY